MAWIRDRHGDPFSLTDEALVEEIRAGEIRPEQEVRHPVWTHNRFQPVHTVPELRAALDAPGALLAARLRRRWVVPWGTLLLLAGAAALVAIQPAVFSWEDLLDLGSGRSLKTAPLLGHRTPDLGWLLEPRRGVWAVMLSWLLVSGAIVTLLARFERAFGMGLALTGATVASAVAVLVAPELLPLAFLFFLCAAMTGVLWQHRALLPWRLRHRYGLRHGLPLLSLFFLLPMPTLFVSGAVGILIAGGIGARVTPPVLLPPAERRRPRVGLVVANVATVGLVLLGIRHFAQHPEQLATWEARPLPPSGITVAVPHLETIRWRPEQEVWLGDPWEHNGAVPMTASLRTSGRSGSSRELTRASGRPGLWAEVGCTDQRQLWRRRLCEAALKRVTFKEPYTDTQLAQAREQMWDSSFHSRLFADIQTLSAADQLGLTRRLLDAYQADTDGYQPRDRIHGAEETARFWRATPALRPPDARAWILEELLDSGWQRYHESKGDTDIGEFLRERPCANIWAEVYSLRPLPSRKAARELLSALGCPSGPDALAAEEGLTFSDAELMMLVNAIGALNEHHGVMAKSDLERLGALYRTARSCEQLSVDLAEEERRPSVPYWPPEQQVIFPAPDQLAVPLLVELSGCGENPPPG